MSVKKRLEFTRKAFRDIAAIEEWIAVDNPKAALDVAASILKTAEQLEVNPSLGRPGREDGTPRTSPAKISLHFDLPPEGPTHPRTGGAAPIAQVPLNEK